MPDTPAHLKSTSPVMVRIAPDGWTQGVSVIIDPEALSDDEIAQFGTQDQSATLSLDGTAAGVQLVSMANDAFGFKRASLRYTDASQVVAGSVAVIGGSSPATVTFRLQQSGVAGVRQARGRARRGPLR